MGKSDRHLLSISNEEICRVARVVDTATLGVIGSYGVLLQDILGAACVSDNGLAGS